MKKLARIIFALSCFVSIVCFVCGPMSVARADELEVVDAPPTMVEYFEGLQENYPLNLLGSCTYVALTMLLTYYDTYLNDNIIPEVYDVPLVKDSWRDVVGGVAWCGKKRL